MKVERPVPEEFWWAVARDCPRASFFHTPLWSRLVTTAFPDLCGASAGLTLPGGARVVLPMVEIARHVRGGFAEAESTYAGCYGGLIADRSLGPGEYAAAWQAVLGQRRIGRLHLTGDPLSGDPGPGLPPSAEDVTHLLDLAPGWERVEAGFSEGHRRSIRRAAAHGLTVAPAAGLDDFRAYFEVYQDSIRRWGDRATNDYPWALFEAGHALQKEHPESLALWLCRDAGQVVAGAWVFSWNQRATYWHGASLTAALDLHPGHVLHAEIVRDACARGRAWYDFNPSGGHAGTARFKRGFGTVLRTVPRWTHESRLFQQAKAVVRALRGGGS
jgi:hypothetical protein